MLRFKSKPIVYVFGPEGEGLLTKNTAASGRLGTKRQCLACGAKYYDLGRKPPVCSRCGASAEPKRSEAASREAASRQGGGRRDGASARRRPAFAPDRPRMVARAGGGDRPGRPMAQAGRAPGVPPLRLCRGRQDDARPPHRRGRARRNGLRRLHRQGGAGDALEGLRGRDHHPCAHLPGERGRGGRAEFHPQRRRAGLARRPHRDRRMLDGRRRAGARSPLVRQADPGAGRPFPAAARQRAAAFSPRARRT